LSIQLSKFRQQLLHRNMGKKSKSKKPGVKSAKPQLKSTSNGNEIGYEGDADADTTTPNTIKIEQNGDDDDTDPFQDEESRISCKS